MMVEETLKELLFQKGLMHLEQGECNDFLECTQYENFSPTLQTSLHKINQKYKNSEISKQALHYYIKAQSYVQTNHKEYSLKELDSAIKIEPQFLDAMLLRGKILWSQNKQAEGNEVFWKIEQIDSLNEEIQEFLKIIVPRADEILKETRYLLVQNELDRCLLNVKKGLELFPNNTQFLLIKSFVLRKQGEYENALNNLLVAYHTLRDQQMESEVKNQISLTYNEMGMVLYNRKQYEEAITLFNESLQFKNTDWGVYTNRGDCHRQLGQIDKAMDDYTKAQKYCPNPNQSDITTRLGMIRNSRGIALFNATKYLAALKEFDEAIKYSDKVSTFYHMRAKCLLQLDQINEAMGDLLTCNKLDPSNIEVAALVKKLKEEPINSKKTTRIILNRDDY